MGDQLVWLPESGVGYYPVKAGVVPYDTEYFERYERMAETFIGRQLMHSRVDFVARHYEGELVDIGIGSGAFIRRRNQVHCFANTSGYDVNPTALEWLRARKLLCNVAMQYPEAVSMWDVLEHIPNFTPLLDRIQEWVFLSLPIFEGAEHVLRSKHFRKDEHCWYFTKLGLIQMMSYHGFELIEHNTDEVTLGREDIGNFAFRRVRTRVVS